MKKDINKELKSLTGRFNLREVFIDVMDIMAISISNSVDYGQFEKREAEYMRYTEKYTKEELTKIGNIFAMIAICVNKEKSDILGELYMEFEFGSKDGAQYFTPQSIADLMAELTVSGDILNKEGLVCTMEPTSGSGTMIIAAMNVINARGYEAKEVMRVYCNDIDRLAVQMCYIQLSMLGIDAICNVGNALLKESREVWYTPRFVENYLKKQLCGTRSMEA